MRPARAVPTLKSLQYRVWIPRVGWKARIKPDYKICGPLFDKVVPILGSLRQEIDAEIEVESDR